jgi:prevent-host-death family protein
VHHDLDTSEIAKAVALGLRSVRTEKGLWSLAVIVLPCSTMTTIGVRELRQHASRWLARVRAGESITVTDRGTPIARLVPLSEPPGLDELIERGGATPGDGDLLSTIARAGGPSSGPSLGDRLEALRADER